MFKPLSDLAELFSRSRSSSPGSDLPGRRFFGRRIFLVMGTIVAGVILFTRCVHMPVRDSKNLTLLMAGQTTASPERVRSHRIAIYR